jgi:hypothetical protein
MYKTQTCFNIYQLCVASPKWQMNAAEIAKHCISVCTNTMIHKLKYDCQPGNTMWLKIHYSLHLHYSCIHCILFILPCNTIPSKTTSSFYLVQENFKRWSTVFLYQLSSVPVSPTVRFHRAQVTRECFLSPATNTWITNCSKCWNTTILPWILQRTNQSTMTTHATQQKQTLESLLFIYNKSNHMSATLTIQ